MTNAAKVNCARQPRQHLLESTQPAALTNRLIKLRAVLAFLLHHHNEIWCAQHIRAVADKVRKLSLSLWRRVITNARVAERQPALTYAKRPFSLLFRLINNRPFGALTRLPPTKHSALWQVAAMRSAEICLAPRCTIEGGCLLLVVVVVVLYE